MSYVLEFNKNRYTKNSHISIYKIKEMCESNDEYMIPYCPHCEVTLICDDQRDQWDHVGWCLRCNEDFYECDITKYEITK